MATYYAVIEFKVQAPSLPILMAIGLLKVEIYGILTLSNDHVKNYSRNWNLVANDFSTLLAPYLVSFGYQ